VTRRIAALLVCGALSLAAAAPTRSVDLEITLPSGATPRAIVADKVGAVVTLPNGTKYGFVPTIQADGKGVVVKVWEIAREPWRMLGSVDVEEGGPVVRSDTAPSFGLRVVRIIRSK
jgi:hypothetical protein